MLTNITYCERKVFINASKKLIPVEVKNYPDLLLDSFLSKSDMEFLSKYTKVNFNFDYAGNLEKGCWITDEILLKTFDGGFAKVKIHKFSGDYSFEYNTLVDSEQILENLENFETLWCNDVLGVQLF